MTSCTVAVILFSGQEQLLIAFCLSLLSAFALFSPVCCSSQSFGLTATNAFLIIICVWTFSFRCDIITDYWLIRPGSVGVTLDADGDSKHWSAASPFSLLSSVSVSFSLLCLLGVHYFPLLSLHGEFFLDSAGSLLLLCLRGWNVCFFMPQKAQTSHLRWLENLWRGSVMLKNNRKR